MPHLIPSIEQTLESLNIYNPNLARKEPLRFPAAVKNTEKPDPFADLPPEPEDAHLTGATRSLFRRLLALNLGKRIAPGPVVIVRHEIKIA